MTAHAGELAALATAACWTVSALAFEAASRRSGALPVNLIRLVMALVFLSAFTWITRGLPFPSDASPRAWMWLSLSGIAGFVFGDLCMFRAFVLIGSRVTMIFMTLVPPMTALLGWAMMGETLTRNHVAGMALTLAGTLLVVLDKQGDTNHEGTGRPMLGILLATGAAVGQAVGLVLSKYGMGVYSAFAATQIRAIAAVACFVLIFAALGAWRRIANGLKDTRAVIHTVTGSVFGPFLGVSCSLLAVQHTKTGIASTIMATVPVLIIPPAVILFKEKMTLRQGLGAAIAVAGVAVLFM